MGSPAGPGISTSLHTDPIGPFRLLEQWQQQLAAGSAQAPAATSLFIGRVRGRTAAGLPLDALELEHYPGMTEAQLQRLATASARRHRVAAVMVRHRVGLVLAGDVIVVVAVLADRRGPAQRCCQELLEALKHHAPFWKREWSSGMGEWVPGNTALDAMDPDATDLDAG
ncbi:MAG: molybdopterin synthase catalytic subunit [Cyanobacteriota bacterium]|jgi:molybdopterin synthase catalytic subunit